MGLDVVELVMAVEDEFGIELSSEVGSALWKGRRDIQVRDFVEMVVEQVARQKPSYPRGDVAQVTRRLISEACCQPESKVTLDAWFKWDLDLD